MKTLIALLFCVLMVTKSGFTQLFAPDTTFQTPLADSRSANWVDLNNDGHLDIFISNGKSGGQNNEAYLNDGNGNFTPLTANSLVLDSSSSVGAAWADLDNQHGIDGVVTTWYNQRNHYYRASVLNNLVEAKSVPPVDIYNNSEQVAFGDVNGDSFLDIIVTNSTGGKTEFYRNNKNGAFDRMNNLLSQSGRKGRGVNFVDINNDGRLDVFITTEGFTNNELYIGDSLGLIASDPNVLNSTPDNAMSSCWGDYDNDGDMDVFISTHGGNNMLYRNEGNFNFTRMDSLVVSSVFGFSFGANWGDVDNDGDLDLYVGNAFSSGSAMLNHFFINNGDGSFTRNTTDTIAKVRGWTYGTAFGDYDKDGDLDLLNANCHNGAQPNHVFKNTTSQSTNPNHWVVIDCEGIVSNTSAIGTRVTAVATIQGKKVRQIREISAPSAYCGQNMLPVHFGMGNAIQIDSLIFHWPSGIKEFYPNLPVDSYHDIKEGNGISLPTGLSFTSPALLNVKVHPNPATHHFSLQFSGIDPTTLQMELVTLEGKLVTQFNELYFVPKNSLTFPIPTTLSRGVYLLKGRVNGLPFTKQLIIH